MDSAIVSSAPAVIAAILLLCIAAASMTWFGRPKGFDVPFVGLNGEDIGKAKAKFVHEADRILKQGYEEFRDSIFQVITPDGPRLFLPRRFASELKGFPREEMSGMKALADRHLGQYTTIDHESDIFLGAIKIDLNQNLGKFVSDVADEVDHIFKTQFPPCEEWTPIDLHDKLLRIVAQASARIFVGPSLNRNEEWLECTSKFATDVMRGGERLKTWPPWLRPIAQFFVPEIRRIRGDHEFAHRLLLPVLKARDMAEKKEGYLKPNDMIQWIRDRAAAKCDLTCDSREQANLQLLVATAAIHTTRLAIVHTIYDLAARPEYLEPLRQEISVSLKKNERSLTKQCLTQLRMLDSFMKESQRHNPPSVATFQRKALVPHTLSNGFHIPAGTIVQCNTNILEQSPASWGRPLEFDGFRFYNFREKPEDANRFQFASPTFDSMQFGLGKDACPGRFFASNQIKIVLAYVLRHYDIALEDKAAGRPKNFMFEVNVLADPTKKILFKRRA